MENWEKRRIKEVGKEIGEGEISRTEEEWVIISGEKERGRGKSEE